MDDWVGEIRFEPDIVAKLFEKHNLTPAEVRAAVAWGGHDEARWDTDPVYGRRLILTGSDDQGSLRAYLRPLNRADGLWECLTAWRI